MGVLILTLVVAVLAVARLARLISEDEVTVGVRRWVVKQFGEDSYPSRLIHCARWCTSLWFALVMPVAVLYPNRWVLAVLAVPAGSMVAALILTTVDKE